MARLTLAVAIYMLAEMFLGFPNIPFYAGIFAVSWSFVFFAITVVWVVYLTSDNYPPDPIRLIFDILISAIFAICSFSIIYRELGITDTLYANYVPNKQDYLYFSTVTFSTLSFGDFRPNENARIWASLEALLGNLHLGLLAGAAFYAVQYKPKKVEQEGELTEQDNRNEADES